MYEEAKAGSAISLSEYPNKPLEGYYLGKREVDTKEGKNSIQQFQKLDGTEIEVWGFDLMNRLLSNVPKGCLTKVTYTGKIEDKEKQKTRHQCTVFFDKEKKLSEVKSDVEDLPF